MSEILTFWAAILLQVGVTAETTFEVSDLPALTRGLTTCSARKFSQGPRCHVQLDAEWKEFADRPYKLAGGGTSKYIGWQNTLLHEACHVEVFEELVYAKAWKVLRTYDSHGDRWKECMATHGGYHNE